MHGVSFRWIRLPLRLAIFARDDWRCVACEIQPRRWRKGSGKKTAFRWDRLSLDHVDPLGGNHPSNLVTMCVRCNTDKGFRHVADWRPELLLAVAERCARTVDRALGLRLCEELDPAFLARDRRGRRMRRLRARREMGRAA